MFWEGLYEDKTLKIKLTLNKILIFVKKRMFSVSEQQHVNFYYRVLLSSNI